MIKYTRTINDSKRIMFYGKFLFAIFFLSIIIQLLFFKTTFANITSIADGYCYYQKTRYSTANDGKAYNVIYFAKNKTYNLKTICIRPAVEYKSKIIIVYNRLNPDIAFDEIILFRYYTIILFIATICYIVGYNMNKNILNEQKNKYKY